MNTVEEQLWNYIDGNCSPAEKIEIEKNLASDVGFALVYKQLLNVNALLNNLDMAEPSMRFTKNVMEQVNLQIAPVALKTKVNKAIVYAITAFFGLSIFTIVCIAISQSKASFTMPNLSFKFDFTQIATPLVLHIFLMTDLVLGLVFLDGVLRKFKAN